jgi:hypothetical protein
MTQSWRWIRLASQPPAYTFRAIRQRRSSGNPRQRGTQTVSGHDTFSVLTSSGYSVSGVIANGNIQVR